MEHFADVIIVGGGHAGIEAAAAVCRMGLLARIVTADTSKVGALSCNPAIGGTAKGQVVKEIDALGGLMGLISDETCLQFKMLNRSKGKAVWSPRAQVSRSRYPLTAQRLLKQLDPDILVEASVDALLIEARRCVGVMLTDGRKLGAQAVIVCAGTFLNGVMHTGLTQTEGGRVGESSATLRTYPQGALNLVTHRLKTGTPPRVSLRSINTSLLDFQSGDDAITPFSRRSERPPTNSIVCWITHTNEETHKLLEAGFEESPMYQGRIQGKGPRYCPSIEDKITRFAEKKQHHLYLEPEDLDDDTIYVNGFSTSLPANVQLTALRSIKGLEDVEMIRAGYAVEYDYFPAWQLHPTMESKAAEGLYFAGQVNGTSGYEEAAAQGLVAGVNAASKIKGLPEFIIGRDEGYIGVLVDDLINKTQEEPYRLFTASSEYRLLLRQDNADLRLTEKAFAHGLVPIEALFKVKEKADLIKKGVEWTELERVVVSQEPLVRDSIKHQFQSKKGILRDYLNSEHAVAKALLADEEALEQVEIELLYEGYLKQSKQLVEKLRKNENQVLPANIFARLTALSTEARQVLTKIQPRTLGQASRLAGVKPSDLALLSVAASKNGS